MKCDIVIDPVTGNNLIQFDSQTLLAMVIEHHDDHWHGLLVVSRIMHSPTVATRQLDKPRLRNTKAIERYNFFIAYAPI
jgi:peptide deformylase